MNINFYDTSKLTNLILLFFILTSINVLGQNTSVGGNQFSNAETPIHTFDMPLTEYNRMADEQGFSPLKENDPRVKPNGTVEFRYEGFKPEESEDQTERSMIPQLNFSQKYPFFNLIQHQPSTAPPVFPISTINGITYDENGTTSGSFNIPADPSGAVGTTHICHVVNNCIDCDTKAGATATGFPQSLANFFTSLSPENGTFDPKIIWDQYESRFVAITLVKTTVAGGDPADISRLLIAVSATADPTGTWYFQAIDVSQIISSNDCWFDYPGLAVDNQAIYITGNYFRFSNNADCGASDVVIIDKGTTGGLYAGTVSNDENPATNAAFNIYNPVNEEGGSGFDVTNQPAHTFGTPPANMGTWLMGYSGLSGGGNEFIQIFRITNPLSSPTFTRQVINVGDIDNLTGMPDAQQSGSGTSIETNDRRTLSAVWQSNKLWVTTQVVPGSGTNSGQATSYAIQFSASGSGATLDRSVEIGGEDISTGAYTFFPSIALDGSGNGYVGFSACNSSMFVGSYAVKIDGSTGGISSALTAQAGTDDYVRTFGGSENRWGDYSNTRVDPSDGSIWTINKSAISNGNASGGEDGQWGVFMVNFSTGEFLPVELVRFEGTIKNNDAILNWTTATEINNKGFEVQKMIEGKFRTIDFIAGAGDTQYEMNYEYVDENLQPGTYYYRLNQVDFDGKNAKSSVVSVTVKMEDTYFLTPPAPSVFSEETNFQLTLKQPQNIVINIFDVYGRNYGELFNGKMTSNETKNFRLRSDDLSQGYYFIVIQGELFKKNMKVMCIK